MSMILRYVRYLRRLNDLGRRVVLNQPLIEVTGVKLGFYQTHSTKGYATDLAVKQQTPILGYGTPLQRFETTLKRGGRVSVVDIEKVLFEVQIAGSISSLEALLMIRSCGRQLVEADNESIRLVQEIWDTCQRINVPMDASHYNALLNVYLEKDHVFSPSEFLSSMLKNSIKPNRVTYQKLLAAYCQQGDISGATKILEIMNDKGLPLCENVFNSLITGHSQVNDIESAIGILTKMESAGITPSSNTYEALLCGYAKNGDVEKIKTTISKLNDSKEISLDRSLLEVIYSLAANKHVAAAEELIDTDIGEIISDTDVSHVLTKLLKINQTSLAIKLLNATSKDKARQHIRSILLVRTAARDKTFPVEDIVQLCNELENEENINRLFQTALYHGLLSHAEPKIIFPLLTAWRENNGEIRNHYFWPLLRSQSKINNHNGMMNILKIMTEDFKLKPCIQTLRDYVIPYMFGTWDDIIVTLETHNIPREETCFAILDRMLLEKKPRNAGIFITSFPMKYPKEIFLEHLSQTLTARDDPVTYLNTLRLLDQDPENINSTSIELIDAGVLKAMDIVPEYRPTVIIKLMEGLMRLGLSMSPEVGERVRSFLNTNLTPGIDEIIKNITSGTLTEVALVESNPYQNSRFRENAPSMGTIELRRQFADCLAEKNTEKVIDILKQMDEINYLSAAVIAQAVDLFCEMENLEAAEMYVNKAKNIESMKLDNIKIMKYATLLIKKDRFDDAIAYITEQPDAEERVKTSRIFQMCMRSLFEAAVQTKNVENLTQLFNMLKSKNFISIDSHSLGPLVKIHILRNDLDKALDVFERACIDHKCTPLKNVLARSFIENEDANSLQKMTDLSTAIHGETNALADLALIFLECNRLPQARKIFETSNVQIHNGKIFNFINRMVALNNFEHIDNLAKVTKGVTRMDRGYLYDTLLNVYNDINNWEKGLALWTEIQEDDVQPTPEFLKQLSNLLMRNGQEVPFVNSDITSYKSPPVLSKESNRQQDLRFDEALIRRDFDMAERVILSTKKPAWTTVKQYGQIIMSLLQENEVDKALHFTRKVITNYSVIKRTSFASMAHKLLETGRVEDFKQLGEIMNESLKIDVHYYKHLSVATINTNGLRSFIENANNISVSFDNGPRSIEYYMHFGAMVNGLILDPSCEQFFIEWANKMLEKGINRPMQVLWNYYFITNSPQAEIYWNNHIRNIHSPLLRPIIEFGKKNKDPELVERLSTLLKQHPQLAINARSRTISALIDIYNCTGRYDDALQMLNVATQRFPINMISINSLKELKAGLERSGKKFPYTINEDKSSAAATETDIICTATL